LRCLGYPAYQVLLVDNGSHNDSLERLQEMFPEVQTLALAENRGFAGGVNPAICQALQQGADYVVLLNNDTLVPHNFLTRLVTAHQQYPDIGVLSPTVVREQQPDMLAGLGCYVQRYTIKLVGWNVTTNSCARHTPVLLDAVFGCAMIVPRDVFERVGLFDERFFFYYEDIDFCQRVRASGYQVAYLPDLVVRHAVAASTSHVRGLRDFYLARSRQLFFRKYRPGIQQVLYTMSEIVQVLRVIRTKLKEGNRPAALGYLAGSLIGLSMPTIQDNEQLKVKVHCI
jgi:hypothetical protein